MKRMLAFAVLVGLVSIAIIFTSKGWASGARPLALAASPQAVAHEGKGCSAPKEWGQLKGVADRNVAFEDAAGNIRILDLGPCMRGETELIVKITRP